MMVVFTIVWLVRGDWALAINAGFFFLASLMFIRINYWTFQRGYARGQADTIEALRRSESPEEFGRLIMSNPPKPWS